MKKLGRNDPCHCGSGQKFKKCCESKMIGGRFMATKLETTTASLTNFFQNRVSLFAAPTHTPKPIIASAPAVAAPAPVENN